MRTGRVGRVSLPEKIETRSLKCLLGHKKTLTPAGRKKEITAMPAWGIGDMQKGAKGRVLGINLQKAAAGNKLGSFMCKKAQKRKPT